MLDYLSYIIFRISGFIIRLLPVEFSLFFARRIGELFYLFDFKHRSVVFANIRLAFADEKSCSQIKNITKQFYRNLAQNFIEIFFIPLVDSRYISKYVKIEGRDNIKKALDKGRGVILLGVHAGSWEISNVLFANMGFTFNLLVRAQGMPKLNSLLDSYRRNKGCKLIRRQNEVRELIEALKNNQAVGMTMDQGGKSGEQVKFLGKFASMATGAVKLALKYGAVIVPGYYTREKGPYIKVILGEPFEVKKSSVSQDDIVSNTRDLTKIFEEFIEKYPQDYFWRYKIWKYSKEKRVLVLSDGKAGHLRQSLALNGLINDLAIEQSLITESKTVEVRYKSILARHLLNIGSLLLGRFGCQGCLWCFKKFLEDNTYRELLHLNPDIIISCGSSLAAVNLILSRQNRASSVVVMRPGLLPLKNFDLVIIPAHDKPPSLNNIVVIDGALSEFNKPRLKEQGDLMLKELSGRKILLREHCIGLLLGGDMKKFRLDPDKVAIVIREVKELAQRLDFDILVTTSRRTSKQVEDLVRSQLSGFERCKFMVIANEKNYDFASGGIIDLSSIVVVSAESISMISEASSGEKYVFVFNLTGLAGKHRVFIDNLVDKKYIYLSEPHELCRKAIDLWSKRPAVEIPNNLLTIKEALRRLL